MSDHHAAAMGESCKLINSLDWRLDCMRWRGRVLTGRKSHWCFDWDGLPVDETTPDEFECCNCDVRDCASEDHAVTVTAATERP